MIFWSSLHRLAHILLVTTRHVLAHVTCGLLARWPVLLAWRFWPIRQLSGPERLRAFFEEVGGTFIKFGQMLALQPDILSLEYCDALFDLLDRVEPCEFAQVEQTFVEELGRRPGEIFDAFDPQPLATASIGQVHIAYLDGRKWAVKVQRPNVETEFAGDVKLMMIAMFIIRLLHLKAFYWMIEPMSEFVAWTREELDYRREAFYLERLRRNAEHNACERVPSMLCDYTTRRTLVMEFLEGITVLDYLRALERGDEVYHRRLKTTGFDAHQLACNIIDNFLGDAFRYGIFHADLHPANLMILPGNVVGYIDFGITGVLSQYARRNLVALTLAYTRGDLDAMCTAFYKVSAMDVDSDPKGYREGLKRLANDWYDVQGKERRLLKNFSLVMLDMLGLSRRTGIWPERGVIKYIRSAIAIDGLVTRFAPNFNVGRYLETVCQRYLKWQARRTLFSYNNLVDWSFSSGRLMNSGALRAAEFLQRVADGEVSYRSGISRTRRDTSEVARLLHLARASFVVSLAIVMTREPVMLGVNLFTAEALLMMAVLLMLWRGARRQRGATEI